MKIITLLNATWPLVGWYLGSLTGRISGEMSLGLLSQVEFYMWLLFWPLMFAGEILLSSPSDPCVLRYGTYLVQMIALIIVGVEFCRWNWRK